MQSVCWLATCLLLLGLLGTRTIALTMTTPTCYQTDDQIRSSFASLYSELVINCLSVTPSGSVDTAVLSTFNSSNNVTARFTVTCVGGTLQFNRSSLAADFSSLDTAGCSSSCVDTAQPCSDPCDPVCARCVGSQPSNCTACALVRLTDGTCADSCPSFNLKPNPDMNMLCQCTSSRYSGNSSEAQHECERLIVLAEEQLVEEEKEQEELKTGRKNLAIGLSTTCVLVLLFCLVMAMLAHKKYRTGGNGFRRYKREGSLHSLVTLQSSF